MENHININKKKSTESNYSMNLIHEINEKLDHLPILKQLEILNHINHCLYEEHNISQSLFNSEPHFSIDYDNFYENEGEELCITF